MKHSRFLLAIIALAAFAATFRNGTAQAAAPRPNVIVILMDALRADVLGPYGYKKRPTTPNLDRFASRSVVWEGAMSQDAWTVPCVASLFTGVDPQAHRTMRYQEKDRIEMDTLSLGHETLAEQFKGAGYTTAAFLKSKVIDSSRGFSQGFDTFTIAPGADQAWGYSAKQLNDVAIPWIVSQKSATKPFFAYLHFMDVHSPYKAPEPWYSKYKTGPSKLSGAHVEIEAMAKNGQVPTADDIERLYALYDAEMEYFDTEFGRLMGELVASGLDANTIVVFTADHGEAFYEHQNWFHGNLYQENIHIPVIMKVPGLTAGRMHGFSQQIDIAPTLADLAGVPRSADWMGRSQVASMKSGSAVGGEVYSEYAEQRMVVDPSGLKLIVNDGPVKLFDLAADPKEKNNLATARTADVTRLRGLLDARLAKGKALASKFPVSAPATLTDEQVEALRALGYVE
jgi:arylsulfatase A-like enzyme